MKRRISEVARHYISASESSGIDGTSIRSEEALRMPGEGHEQGGESSSAQ
jgi:hypothetical protein